MPALLVQKSCVFRSFFFVLIDDHRLQTTSTTPNKQKNNKAIVFCMVKVLIFSLFDAQKVVGTDEEPVEIVAAGNSFLTATKQGTIILYEHANECVPVFTLRTVNDDILSLNVIWVSLFHSLSLSV